MQEVVLDIPEIVLTKKDLFFFLHSLAVQEKNLLKDIRCEILL